MPTLQEVLDDKSKRAALVEDCTKLIDDEVQKKGGISGIAVKTGYKVVKGLKPGFVREATDALIDEFAQRLQPFVNEAKEKEQGIASFFDAERSRVAEALLGITDQRAERSNKKVVTSSYYKLRPTGKKHVEEAASGVGRLVEKYTCG